ncbi:MAG TPA: aldo/keto reductase [Candidatus Binataceae bacterium]|nr:aldo/keto reductase [Candidatus Binataceae bacterium]
MELRRLGNSGLQVSVVGLGCNNFGMKIDVDATRKVVDKAIDVGITLFDTADIYGNRGQSETFLGQILGERRKSIVLATKFGMQMDKAGTLKGGSRRYIMSAVEDSLRRLKTDWIDLYQIHQADPMTPIEETLRALDDLIRQGKVRYIGCSNLPAWQVVEAQWTSRHLGLNAFISCQDEYSLLVRDLDKEMIPAMQSSGLGMLPYFPLASGMLTGKYSRNASVPEGTRFAMMKALADRWVNDTNWGIVEQLEDFATKRGHTILELAFSWLAARPTVSSVIAGATTPEQVEQNTKAIEWKMSAEDLAEIDKITRKK